MQTSDLLKKIDISRHKFYYLEQKGYIKPKRLPTQVGQGTRIAGQQWKNRNYMMVF
jgi:hypothetical protein